VEQQKIISALASDTLKGLSSSPRYLLSKYFYDDAGSAIFQEIMKMPEYYLTRCEQEILNTHKASIAASFFKDNKSFSLVELGSGDGFKTKILLQYMARSNVQFHYIPMDISQKANDILYETVKKEIPEIEIHPRTGDYFTHLSDLNGFAFSRKILLFLGSNIGNFSRNETNEFLNQISSFTNKGDKVLIGFDLKKDPKVIMDAYNDPHGHTRRFNLNLLVRLNRELSSNFNINLFDQYSEYNPLTGGVRSFLISLKKQEVHVKQLDKTFVFEKWEPIFTERSVKFDFQSIENLAAEHGFRILNNYQDKCNNFTDSLWEKL